MRPEGMGRHGLLAASSDTLQHWFAMQKWSKWTHIHMRAANIDEGELCDASNVENRIWRGLSRRRISTVQLDLPQA